MVIEVTHLCSSEQCAFEPNHAIEGPRTDRRPKGKRTKRARKPRVRRSDPATTRPPKSGYIANQCLTTWGNGHTATEDQVKSSLQDNEATIPNYGQESAKQLHRAHYHEDIPASQDDNVNENFGPGQSHDGSVIKNIVEAGEAVDATPGPTPVEVEEETGPGAGSYMPPVSLVQSHSESKSLGSNIGDCLENSQVVISGHDLIENDTESYETSGHGSPQVGANGHARNSNTNLNMQEAHEYAYYTRKMPQHHGFKALPELTDFQAKTIVLDAPTGSIHSQQPREFQDSVLHTNSSRGSSIRISKTRSKKRTNGPSTSLALRNPGDGASLSSSPDHEVILNMMAMCLRAGDSKARNIVDTNAKAHGAAIASLQETIVQQNCTIQNLQSQNDNLNGRVQKMSDSTTQWKKYVKGMEGDYARLKSQTEAHCKNSDKLVKDSVHGLEQERSVLKNNFLQTIEVLHTSQRHMREAMNDCFTQLVLSENKHQSVSKQLHKLAADYDAERKKNSDLEQQILPVVQTIQDRLAENHRIIIEKVGEIQVSVNDKSTEQERDICLKECLDTIHSFRSVPVPTVNDLRKAEGMLRFIYER